MVKAIFFDFDGTLLSFETHEIPPSTLQALEQLREKGIKIFLATGRAPGVSDFIKEIFEFDAYIYMNGQYCVDKGELVHHYPMDKEDVLALIEQSYTNKYSYCFVDHMHSHMDKISPELTQVYEDVDQPIPKLVDAQTMANKTIYQVLATVPVGEEHIITDVAKNVEIARWHPLFVDVIPANGGKHQGVEVMLKRYNIDVKHSMAFGDGENDISMIKYVNFGIAMGNASDIVKEAADHVTTTVDEDGIMNALKYFKVL
ncbi:MAG: Cof-type HAD-IIB family hydrolase [Christensenellaceae bacterium]|nr:Cof-type HAD-IIB family hydrolase [Christensenellaceae bacterium]